MPQYISSFAQIERLPGAAEKIGQFVFDTVSNNYIFTGSNGEIEDPTVESAWILGGSPGYKHIIGTSTETPTTAGSTTSWGADSSYAGGIVVAGAIGGYDTIVNQTGGGTILANHCMVKYNVNGHSYIIGGSTCVIAGSRSAILASRESEIGGSSTFSTILSADNCEIQSAAYCLLTGLNNNIASGGSYSFILGSDSDVLSNHSVAFVQGRFIDSPQSLSHTIGTKAFVENNDLRRWVALDYKRTTNATGTNSQLLGSALPSGKTTAGLLRIKVTALQDGSADGDNSGTYAVGSWSADVGFRWDGTNGYLYTSSATSGPTTGPTMGLTAIRDDIGVAAVPAVALSTGLLRAQVTGKASTTINWCIEYEVLHTLVS